MRRVFAAFLALLLFMSFPQFARAEEAITLPIEVEVNGETVIAISPEAGSPAYPTPTLTVVNRETLSFSFTGPGDYSYTVEQAGTDPTVYYDDTVYLVQFHIELNAKGKLEGVVSLSKQGSEYKEEKIVFENGSAAPVTDDPPVEKQILGKPKSHAAFTFVLEAVTDGAPMPVGSIGGRKTAIVTGPGTVEFGTIRFALAGTYEYRVTEQKGTETGYTYDSASYTLHYEITEKSGALSKALTIYKNGEKTDALKAVFVNEYTETETETKTVTRTIYYREYDKNGKEVSKPVIQTVTLTRTKITNPDGTVTYTPWTGTAPEVLSPPYPGWSADRPVVLTWEIDTNDPRDVVEWVFYTPTPETGDSFEPLLWGGLALGAGGLACVMLFLRRGRKRKQKE